MLHLEFQVEMPILDDIFIQITKKEIQIGIYGEYVTMKM